MSIRIEVQLDHQSASMRYLATATLDGKHLHEVGQFGVPEDVLRKMTEWLQGQGYPLPDHYWLKTFSPKEQWQQQKFPK